MKLSGIGIRRLLQISSALVIVGLGPGDREPPVVSSACSFVYLPSWPRIFDWPGDSGLLGVARLRCFPTLREPRMKCEDRQLTSNIIGIPVGIGSIKNHRRISFMIPAFSP